MHLKAHFEPLLHLLALIVAASWGVGCNLDGLSSDFYDVGEEEPSLSSCQPGQVRCTTNSDYLICPASGDLSLVETYGSCGEGTTCVTGAATRERPCIRYRNLCQDGEPVSVDRELLSFKDIDTLKPTRRTVNLTNCGPDYLRIDAVDVLSPPTFSDEEIAAPVVLAPGEVAPLQVVYRPTYESEQEQGELRVIATRLDQPGAFTGAPLGTLYIPLEGRAGRQPGQAPIQSRVLDFGEKVVGQQVAVTNIELVHSDIADYTLQYVEEIDRVGADADTLALEWSGAPLELPRGVRRSLRARFAPESTGVASATYRMVITPWPADTALPTVTLQGAGIPPRETCNPSITPHLTASEADAPESMSDDRLTVKPMTHVRLDAAALHASGAAIARYHVTLLEAPRGSTATILGSHEAASPNRDVVVDLVGRYTIRLALEDTAGRVTCDTHDVVIDVRPESEMHVELIWETPGAMGDAASADLDLHVVREKRAGDRPPDHWSLDPADCSPLNPNLDWGAPRVTADDCRVLRVDQDGSGPEIIDIRSVDDRYYEIEVQGVTDRGFGPSFATLQLYIHGERRVVLGSPGIEAGATWEAVRIRPSLSDLQIIDKLIE
ncbi:MAG: hypothetical protein CMH57_02365 [Myxococcales bacterium]|nr:hypothetical protein [Myxococcales bacterium]